MAQYALPTSDITVTNWAEAVGDGDGDAFDELDEGFGAGRGSGSGPDTSTYWGTTLETSNTLRCGISSITDPAVSTGHTVRIHCRKDNSGGRQLDLVFILRDADTIFTDIGNTDLPAFWATYTHSLSGAEADSIDGYATLDIEVQIIENGGGTPRLGWFTAMEFECPDASGGGGGFAHSQGVFVG